MKLVMTINKTMTKIIDYNQCGLKYSIDYSPKNTLIDDFMTLLKYQSI